MPIYEYKCNKCGNVFEIRQNFGDKQVECCQEEGCKGKVTKLFSPPAIIFKGSGFHVNDYGRGGGARKPASSSAKNENCASCDKASSCAKED